MILRNLAWRKLRTLLSVLGVALSIAATIALLRVSLGLVGQISALVSEAGKVKVDDPRKVGAVQQAIEARFPDVTAITSGRPSS